MELLGNKSGKLNISRVKKIAYSQLAPSYLIRTFLFNNANGEISLFGITIDNDNCFFLHAYHTLLQHDQLLSKLRDTHIYNILVVLNIVHIH